MQCVFSLPRAVELLGASRLEALGCELASALDEASHDAPPFAAAAATAAPPPPQQQPPPPHAPARPGAPPCLFFARGACSRGAGCAFSHDAAAPRPPCRFFGRGGGCTSGSRCAFAHDAGGAAPATTASHATPPPPPPPPPSYLDIMRGAAAPQAPPPAAGGPVKSKDLTAPPLHRVPPPLARLILSSRAPFPGACALMLGETDFGFAAAVACTF